MITSRGLEFCEMVHDCNNCKYYESKKGRCGIRMIDGIYGYKKTRPCDYYKAKDYTKPQDELIGLLNSKSTGIKPVQYSIMKPARYTNNSALSDESNVVYADNKAYYIHNMVSPELKQKNQKDDFFLMFSIKKVIFNDPATIVFWKDGEKTVVKCQDGEEFDKEKGLAMAIVKYCCGNHGFYNDIFRKWCDEDEDENDKEEISSPFENLIKMAKGLSVCKEGNNEHDRSE